MTRLAPKHSAKSTISFSSQGDPLAFRSRIQIVPRRLSELKPYPGNPRKHDRRQIKQIAHSIETFGFIVPVLVDRDDNIVAGHGRVLAAKALGWREIPVIQLEHLTEAQIQAYRIADNRLTENSAWDERLLAEELKVLSALELDFSMEVIGFTMGEIDLRIEGLEAAPGEEDQDDLLTPPGPAVSQAGDLWLLGCHRVLCASATDARAYALLMEKEQAVMVFTDPPYNVAIDGHVSGLGAVRHHDFVMASGEMSEAEFTAFLTQACSLLARHSVDGSLHFICMDWRHMSELLAAGRDAYADLKNVCVWVKNNGGMGSLYRSQHELVFVYKKGKRPHRNNVQLGRHGRNRSNVWQYPGANTFSRGSEEGNLLALHPTVKPLALVVDALLDCSARGDVVLDVFLGSGTTVIAAERTRRRCFGLELDPAYVDTVIRRWQAYTGEAARHAATGKTFDDLAAERT